VCHGGRNVLGILGLQRYAISINVASAFEKDLPNLPRHVAARRDEANESRRPHVGAHRAIIRLGDKTNHGGTIIEGFPTAILYGRPIAGKGHKVTCPKCRGTFVIAEGIGNHSFYDVNTAVEGMHTTCGAVLLASQQSATIEIDDGAGKPWSSSPDAAGEGESLGDEPGDGGEAIEQSFVLLDQDDVPVQGYHYDLYRDGELHTQAASYWNGETVAVQGDAELGLVTWMFRDGASRT
jgi:uncharacterized Zn-binding protein involved in type VI secretion